MPNNFNLVFRRKNKIWRKMEQVLTSSRKPRSKIPRLKRVPPFTIPAGTSEEKFKEAKLELSASSTLTQFPSAASCNSSVVWTRPEKSKKRARNPCQEKENEVSRVLDIEPETDHSSRIGIRSHGKKRRSARSALDLVSAKNDRGFCNSNVLLQRKSKTNEDPCQIVVSARENGNGTLEVRKPIRHVYVARLHRAKDSKPPRMEENSASVIGISESFCIESAREVKIAQNVCQIGTEGKTRSNFNEPTTCQELQNFEYGSDLACSEKLKNGDESDYETCEELTSQELSPGSPDAEAYFSAFSLSSLSSGDLCKISSGTSGQSPCFSLYLQYTKEFVRLTAFSKPTKEYQDEFILLKLEDEEHEESYQMFRCWERRHVPPHDYTDDYNSMAEEGEMVLHQRLLMVHWILQHAGVKGLHSETLFLGVSLLDRFLREGFFPCKKNLQLLGIACCTLATRLGENQLLNSVREMMFQVGSNSYSRREVVAMEWLVQEVLHFDCLFPTVYNFLWFYLKAAKADMEVQRTTKYLALQCLLDHERLSFWPSTVAAGLVILASLAANCQSSCDRIIETHVRTKSDDLPECIESLDWLVTYACS